MHHSACLCTFYLYNNLKTIVKYMKFFFFHEISKEKILLTNIQNEAQILD